MNRMPEKQTASRTVSNCALSCFYQYSNHLFFCLRSNKLKYPGLIFFTTFRFDSFHTYYFCESWILSRELTLSEGKKTLRKCCVYNQGDMYLFCFTHTLTLMQIPLHSADFAGDINVAFDFSGACLFGHPVYFDDQDFLSFASEFSFQSFVGKWWEMQ